MSHRRFVGAAGVRQVARRAPSVSAVSPATGSVLGATAIVISGGGFDVSSTVTVGGGAATAVVFVTPNLITAVTPLHLAGAVDLVVTTSGVTATLAGGYTYA